MPTVATLDPLTLSTLKPEDIIFYKEEGYLLVRGALKHDTTGALCREVLDIMKTLGLPVTKLKQTGQYVAGSNLDALINSPGLRDLAGQLMGGASSIYMPFTAVKSAGGGRFHFHQDNQYTRLDGPALNCWFALTPMNAGNGALQIIPRSHLEGTLASTVSGDGDQHKRITWEPEAQNFITMNMEPGDLVIFDRLTVHGSGANSTPQPRVAYAVQFHADQTRGHYFGKWRSIKDQPRFDCRPVPKISKDLPSRNLTYEEK